MGMRRVKMLSSLLGERRRKHSLLLLEVLIRLSVMHTDAKRKCAAELLRLARRVGKNEAVSPVKGGEPKKLLRASQVPDIPLQTYRR